MKRNGAAAASVQREKTEKGRRKMIYLASKSPRRSEILSSAGIKFKTVETSADESCGFTPSPEELVMGLANRKLRCAKVDAGQDERQRVLLAIAIHHNDSPFYKQSLPFIS